MKWEIKPFRQWMQLTELCKVAKITISEATYLNTHTFQFLLNKTRHTNLTSQGLVYILKYLGLSGNRLYREVLLEIKYKLPIFYRQGSHNHLIRILSEMKTYLITELIG